MVNSIEKQGCCYKLIKDISDSSIDLILTDPPYNISSKNTDNIKFKTRKDINQKIAPWDNLSLNTSFLAKEFKRILKPTGNIFIFAGHNQIGNWFNVLDPLFDSTNFFIWHKTNPVPHVRKTGFLNACELLITSWNKGHTWNFTTQKEMHNFFESPICMGQERLKHPTQKPVKLLKHIINIASNKLDTVLDCFMGVGSTGQASLELNRKFIGFELNKEYYLLSKNRLKNYQICLY